jgi:hypothetical protein
MVKVAYLGLRLQTARQWVARPAFARAASCKWAWAAARFLPCYFHGLCGGPQSRVRCQESEQEFEQCASRAKVSLHASRQSLPSPLPRSGKVRVGEFRRGRAPVRGKVVVVSALGRANMFWDHGYHHDWTINSNTGHDGLKQYLSTKICTKFYDTERIDRVQGKVFQSVEISM